MAVDAEILLVEDNPDDATLILRQLAKFGHADRTTWVKTGEEALDFIFGTGSYARQTDVVQIKVILLDLNLPKMSGLEVLKTLKSYDRTSTIPVVILTGSSEEKDILTSYERGASSYIVKPVTADAFIRAVTELGQYWLARNQPPP